jgi:hypothetical protein
MVLDHDYVVDGTEFSTSTFATRSLSGLKYEVKLHHAEASPAANRRSLSFNGFAQYFESFAVFVTVDCF